MQMAFGPLNDGNPNKHRLEADVIGSGPAWISTNGITIKGTWKKTARRRARPGSSTPTGKPVVLTVGQTFIQVMKTTDAIALHAAASRRCRDPPAAGQPRRSSPVRGPGQPTVGRPTSA